MSHLHERVEELRSERERVVADYGKMERALGSRAINYEEFSYLVAQQFGGLTKEQHLRRIDEKLAIFSRHARPAEVTTEGRHPLRTGALLVLLFSFMAALFMISGYLGDGITGFTVMEDGAAEGFIINDSYNTSTNFTMEVDGVVGLQASGRLNGAGSARIFAVINGSELLVASVEASDEIAYALFADKESYTLGETVTMTLSPAAETVTYYAYVDEEAIPLVNNSFVPAIAGAYRVDALITIEDEVVKESVVFVVEAVQNATNTTENNITANTTTIPRVEEEKGEEILDFSLVCIDTCAFEPYSGEIIMMIEVDIYAHNVVTGTGSSFLKLCLDGILSKQKTR